jgi:glycosyltransferase involved in cell wall biosynthesis
LRLAYVGKLLADRRTLSDVLAALAKLDARIGLQGRIVLEVIGGGSGADETGNQIAQLGLQSVVKLRGQVSYLESLKAMCQADVLVHVDAPARVNVFLASKLADYIMLNRPIVSITPRVGASADILRQSGLPVCEPGDVDAVVRAIDDLLRLHESGAPLPAVPRSLAERYSLAAATARFIIVLDEVARPRETIVE